MRRSIVIGLLVAALIPVAAAAQNCEPDSVAVQILGSGGPQINPFRSSTSYLLWVGDQARVLVDMGGGAYGRFGQTQAKLTDLSLVAVSHLHPDHISDLPAFLWQSHLIRKEPLPVVGPSGNDAAPDFSTFLSRLFDEKDGAFPTLGATLGGKRRDIPGTPRPNDGTVRLDVAVVDVTKAEPMTVYDRDGLTVTALGIPHGNMPTLAYRVKVRNMSIVFSSDQTGTEPKVRRFRKGREYSDHASGSCGRRQEQSAACCTGRCRQSRARGGRWTAYRQPYRHFQSRCRLGRTQNELHWSTDGRCRSAVHAGEMNGKSCMLTMSASGRHETDLPTGADDVRCSG